MPPTDTSKIYSATYSNVPVYEYNVGGNHVMRRRSDDWINATHILKVADFDKPARTRILEREVQKGVHEKVQGGYGKYQGTWIPLHDGRILAERNGVLEKLLPILDFVPGDRSPPPAPKHATAASSKPRANRQAAQQRRAPGQRQSYAPLDAPMLTVPPALSHISEEYDPAITQTGTPDNVTIASESFMDETHFFDDASQFTHPTTSRKRKREEDFLTPADQQHQLWADELLDYFMLLDDAPPDPYHPPPIPPPEIDLDRPIDEKGHTALHWAVAMGCLDVVKDLIGRGARIDSQNKEGQTPLMRAVMFTNNYDKRSMEKLASWLAQTVPIQDYFSSTVFHHIAATTSSKSKYACARYYIDCLLNKMTEAFSPYDIEAMLNKQDRNGDTAVHIAARNGARKCVRSLIGRNASVEFPNNNGETADEMIVQLNQRRRDGRHRALSSSPFQMDSSSGATSLLLNGGDHPISSLPNALGLGLPTPHHTSEAASALTDQIFPTLLTKSEKLASAYDAEMAERENEEREAEHIYRARKEEIEALKRQSMELALRDVEDGEDERQQTELDNLIKEVEGLVEEEQGKVLRGLVERNMNGNAGNATMQLDGGPEGAHDKLSLVRALRERQQERVRLVREVVLHHSLAGMGEKQAQYKRLITGALGVREEDVEGMLPEILAELEDWQGVEGLTGG